MAPTTVEDVQAQRARNEKTRREIAGVEAEQRVRRERHAKLVQDLKDGYGLAPDEVPAWLAEQEKAADVARSASEAKRKAAEKGLALIKRAQAGEDVDLSELVAADRLVASDEDVEDLP